MAKAFLVTQCLQNDFVKPLEKYDPLPNQLHVGYSEARRLMGEVPVHGPVYQLMRWAYQQPELAIVNIRDWHSSKDEKQQEHLTRFGEHCLQNSRGAEFVFEEIRQVSGREIIINASGLNDFYQTELEVALREAMDAPSRIGIIGVWTDVKVLHLAYELRTRYPLAEIAVCSALTASSSRSQHFIALSHMQKMLDIKLISSVSSFGSFLLSEKITHEIFEQSQTYDVQLEFLNNATLAQTDSAIVKYLFRDSQTAKLKVLDGGFSGNVVMKAVGINLYGHKQVPTVIKIGSRDLIAQERESFERIQEVLGNTAPSIVDFVEMGERGAIKYRYASMIEGAEKTFQDFYSQSDDLERIKKFLDIVFVRQLGRLYEAKQQQKTNLLQYYDFQSKYAAGVKRRVLALPKVELDGGVLNIPLRPNITNIIDFYEKKPEELLKDFETSHFFAFIHGDLNGRNIIIDSHDNVWLIDFFHTKEGHIIQDLVKLENDILFIFTKISEAELDQAYLLSEILTSCKDLSFGLDITDLERFKSVSLRKAFEVIAQLRVFYTNLIDLDRDPLQLSIAQMRYSVHNLSFDESDDLQKTWALYHSSLACQKIQDSIAGSNKLRMDFLNSTFAPAQFIAITILPGRRDRKRELTTDLNVILENKIDAVMVLLPQIELEEYGVGELMTVYRQKNLDVYHLPIVDQGVASLEEMHLAVDWLKQQLDQKRKILIHCTGGLGRSGTVAACFLKKYGQLSAVEAILQVRQSRSMRAIENEKQEHFVADFR